MVTKLIAKFVAKKSWLLNFCNQGFCNKKNLINFEFFAINFVVAKIIFSCSDDWKGILELSLLENSHEYDGGGFFLLGELIVGFFPPYRKVDDSCHLHRTDISRMIKSVGQVNCWRRLIMLASIRICSIKETILGLVAGIGWGFLTSHFAILETFQENHFWKVGWSGGLLFNIFLKDLDKILPLASIYYCTSLSLLSWLYWSDFELLSVFKKLVDDSKSKLDRLLDLQK